MICGKSGFHSKMYKFHSAKTTLVHEMGFSYNIITRLFLPLSKNVQEFYDFRGATVFDESGQHS